MDFEEVKPHAQDQSNKVVANNSKSLSLESTESSNMRLFLSLQIIHITQNGTKFQTFEECFPKQFLQPASKSITLLGRNQETSKDLRAKLHDRKTSPQNVSFFFFPNINPYFFICNFGDLLPIKTLLLVALTWVFAMFYESWVLGLPQESVF